LVLWAVDTAFYLRNFYCSHRKNALILTD
jgi:hypothetical protein